MAANYLRIDLEDNFPLRLHERVELSAAKLGPEVLTERDSDEHKLKVKSRACLI
jgi:hypothetical protein